MCLGLTILDHKNNCVVVPLISFFECLENLINDASQAIFKIKETTKKTISEFKWRPLNPRKIIKQINNFGKNLFCCISPLKIKKLRVVELKINQREELSKTFEVWKQFAQEKSEKESQQKNIFANSKDICLWGIDTLKKDVDCKHRIFICTQSAFNPEAITIISEKTTAPSADSPSKPYLYVEYLVTHPKNIRSPLNENEPNRVNGAGSAIISALIQLGREENKDTIQLHSLSSARPFYEKLGFIPTINDNLYTLKIESAACKI